MTLLKHSRWNRRQALWLIAGAVGGLGLHACNSSSAQSTPASLGINPWVGYTPLYIAQDKGFFKELGLNLDPKTFSSPADAMVAFTAGRLNGYAPVTSEAVLMAAKGTDYKIVLVADNSMGADGILARNSIASAQDLKGKEIAVEQGSVSHFFLLQFLKEAGLNGKDVKIINVTPDAAAAAYQAGKVEAAVTFAPYLGKANAAQKDGRIVHDSSRMPSAIIDFYAFDSKFVEANPKAIEAFVNGIFKALDFLNENPQEALAIGAKHLGLKPEELAEQLKGVRLLDRNTNLEMLSNSESKLYLLNSLNNLASFLKEEKQIKEVPDLSRVLEPKFVRAAIISGSSVG